MSRAVPTKILVYGVTGSGKTTLAEKISQSTGIPWHSVDDLTWLPGWVEVPLDEQRAKISRIVESDEWILDTAYGKWLDIPLARVELIAALDLPRAVSFWRLLRRSVSRAIDKRPVCNGNTESWRLMLSRDSILSWHLKSFHRKRARIKQWQADPSRAVIVLHSPREVEGWLASLSAN